jgi:small subunit ribosomal protein S3
MGQKVHPTGFRTGITEPWKSRWYASKKDFKVLLLEDVKVRKFLKTKYRAAAIPKVEIERTRDEVKVILHCARPGVIIGRKGQEVDRLQEELQELLGRRVNLKVEEVSRPEIQAQLIAEDIADQLTKRAAFRRTLKRALDTTMDAGARGVKIQLAGRLGGAEMSRCEKAIAGSMPLSTLRRRRATSGFKCGSTKACTRRLAMALMPKRVKHRKSQRGRIRGDASRGNRVVFGDFGLQAEQPGWLPAATIEAGRIAAQQYLRTEGRLYVRVFPHKSITSIPLETRMGKGKGEPEYWAAVIKPGMILYEIGGVTEDAARICMARLAHKMPIRVRFVKRRVM